MGLLLDVNPANLYCLKWGFLWGKSNHLFQSRWLMDREISPLLKSPPQNKGGGQVSLGLYHKQKADITEEGTETGVTVSECSSLWFSVEQ